MNSPTLFTSTLLCLSLCALSKANQSHGEVVGTSRACSTGAQRLCKYPYSQRARRYFWMLLMSGRKQAFFLSCSGANYIFVGILWCLLCCSFAVFGERKLSSLRISSLIFPWAQTYSALDIVHFD